MDGKKVTSLSPDVCQVDNNGYRVPLGSDKFVKHLNCAGDKDAANKWEFDSPSSLTLVPVGSLAYLGNAGLTNRHANGGNLPVLDVAVLVGEGFLSGKDYMNGRYVDVSTTCCINEDDVLFLYTCAVCTVMEHQPFKQSNPI